jgi:hypothetical protein
VTLSQTIITDDKTGNEYVLELMEIGIDVICGG